jgi:hypothetical protein
MLMIMMTLVGSLALFVAGLISLCAIKVQFSSYTADSNTVKYAAVQNALGNPCYALTDSIIDYLYWSYRGTERGNNYTSESHVIQRWLNAFFDRVKNLLRKNVEEVKLVMLLLLVGIFLIVFFFTLNPGVATGIFAAGTGVPFIPNKEKENKMNHIDSLIHLLFGRDKDAIIDWANDTSIDTNGIIDVHVHTLTFDKGYAKETPVMIDVPGTGDKKTPLILHKRCVQSVANLELDGIKYYHVAIPRDAVEAKMVRLNIVKFMLSNKLVPFGSIKIDKKHRTKFYTVPLSIAQRIANNVGEFLPYFHKVYTDCNSVDIYRVKVVNPATFDTDGNVVKHNELYAYGVDDKNDGCGLIKPSLGCHQFQAIPVNCLHGKLPIAKGFLDARLFMEDSDWYDEFGDFDMIIFRQDQIKTFPDLADSGDWVVGFTWMDSREITYPFHWELTQFLMVDDKVRTVLKDSIDRALVELFDRVSTRKGLISYISTKIAKSVDEGWQTKIKMKVLAMLLSKATWRFEWVKKQITSMLLADIWNITKSSGVFGIGIPLLTSDAHSEVDPRYVPSTVTHAVGGDNDGDYIVYLVNKTIGKMLYWRFPVVSGAVLRDIPATLMDKLDDHHPEIVELFVTNGFNLNFSRDDIKTTRNCDDLIEGVFTAEEIMEGEGIGTNTNILKRLLSCYSEDVHEVVCDYTKGEILTMSRNAMMGIESGALALKHHVTGVEGVFPKSIVYELYPMLYARIKSPTSWKAVHHAIGDLSVLPTVRKELELGLDLDSELYVYALKRATSLYDDWMRDVITPSRMRRYIDITDVHVNKANVQSAHRMCSAFGHAMHNVYNQFNVESDGDGNHDDEFRVAVSAVMRATERYGSTLSTDVLKLAVYEYLAKTKGTGATAVHMCGNRIFEVFGKDATDDHVYMDLPTRTSQEYFIEAVRRGGDIPYDDLDVSTAKIHGNTVRFKGGIRLELLDAVPSSGKVLQVVKFTTKEGKASNRKALLTVVVN